MKKWHLIYTRHLRLTLWRWNAPVWGLPAFSLRYRTFFWDLGSYSIEAHVR